MNSAKPPQENEAHVTQILPFPNKLIKTEPQIDFEEGLAKDYLEHYVNDPLNLHLENGNKFHRNKTPLTNAERQKLYRERHKNTEANELWRKKCAERAKKRRESQKLFLENLDEEQRQEWVEKQRLANREKQRRHRETLKKRQSEQNMFGDDHSGLATEENSLVDDECSQSHCKMCMDYFEARNRWTKHMESHRKKNLETNITEPTSNCHLEQFKCSVCKIIYRSEQFLDIHNVVHSADSDLFFQCQHCLVAFPQNSELQIHLVQRLKEGSCGTLFPGIYSG